MIRLLLLSLLLLPLHVFAQHFEVGGMIGASTYEGDLTSSTIPGMIQQTHIAFGAFARYNVNDFVAAKLNVYRGTISGDDALENRARNLDFTSNILEVGLNAEFNILGYQPYNLQRIFSPYIFAGVAYFRFNPFTYHEGEKVFLQPLGTEGQGLSDRPERYNLNQISIPVGGGLKFAVNDKVNIGIEVGARKTFIDHLDDVGGYYLDNDELAAGNGELAATLADRSGLNIEGGRLRGNPQRLDWYLMGGVTVSYNFADNGLVGARRNGKSKTGCPTW